MTLDELRNKVEAYFDANEWPVTFDDESDTRFSVDTGIRLEGKYKNCDVRYVFEKDWICSLAFFNIAPEKEEAMSEMMKFVTRLNCSKIRYHRIELDLDDGTLRVCYDVDIKGQESISDEIFENIIYGPGNVIQRYSSYFLDIYLGYSTADDAWGGLNALQEANDIITDGDNDSES